MGTGWRAASMAWAIEAIELAGQGVRFALRAGGAG
jgi:hypothetical protein